MTTRAPTAPLAEDQPTEVARPERNRHPDKTKPGPSAGFPFVAGGADTRIRTEDLLFTKQLLYR